METRQASGSVSQVRTVALVAVAVGASAVWARLLSRDLMSPAWALFGIVALTGLVTWLLWRPGRTVHVVASLAVAAGCLLAAWAAWMPTSAVLPQAHLLSTLHDNADSAGAQALAVWQEVGAGSCQPANTTDLGLVGDMGSWEQVCASGRTADDAHVTYTPTDAGTLTIVYGRGGPGLPGVCARQVADRWWAVATPDRADAAEPCAAGFTYHGV